MSDLLTIGKVWELGQRPRHKPRTDPYDLVILDAPASGQLVGLLAAPRTFREIARVGPVARQAGRIERAIADEADVGAVVVATPEQMAVTEALGLQAALSGRFGDRARSARGRTGCCRRGSAPKMGSPWPPLPTIRPSGALDGSTPARRRRRASSSDWWASFRPSPASHCRFYSKRSSAGRTSSTSPICSTGGPMNRLDSALVGQARGHLCRRGRRGQDHSLGSGRARACRPRPTGGARHDRPRAPAWRRRSGSMRSAICPRSWTWPGSAARASRSRASWRR